jgi:chloramphenicol 3-O-phosphotransferase
MHHLDSVVLLSGPVGAGKTTIARALIASAPGAIAHIEGDAFWSFIAKPLQGQPEGQGFKMIMRAMTASARHFARDGYEVILDFSIPPWYLDAIRALLVGKPFDYVILRPSEAICAARAAARSEGAIVDYAPYHDLYAAFEALDGFTIHDDHNDAATVAARIRAGLEAGTFRTS